MSSDFYERNGYSVKDIRIETPLDFIGVVKKPLEAKLEEARTSLLRNNRGLKIDERFSNLGYTELLSDLTSRIGSLEPGERFKFVATIPSLQSCDTRAKTVVVVFQVVTSGPISYIASIYEKRHDRLTRELAPGAFSRVMGRFLPQPYMGYNRSRGLYGGTKASYKFDDDFINKVDISVSGSASSKTGDMALVGNRDFETGVINHAEWRLGYKYSDIPSDPVRLKDATVLGQFFGATRPLGASGMILRFGSSFEGGNRQTNLDQKLLPLTVVARSGYGAAKMYVGGTLNQGRQAWTASYGLQLGENGNGLRVEYVKHIADTSYTTRFLPREHLPLRLDAQFNAGLIQSSSGRIPVNERFFGGNATQDFIQGDEWRIRSSPFIRSFPLNRLNLLVPGMHIGGDNFFSANLTIAQTVWGRPAIPSDILRDVRVKQALGGQLAGSRLFAVSSYLGETEQFTALKATLKGEVDKQLEGILRDLQTTNLPAASIQIDLDEFKGEIGEVRNTIAEKEIDEDTGEVRNSTLEFRHIRSLAVGFNEKPETSKIGAIVKTITDEILLPLRDAGLMELHDRLKGHNEKLEASRKVVQESYDAIAKLVATDPQELKEAQSGLEKIAAHLAKLGTILDGIEQQIGSLPEETKQALQDSIERTRSYVDTSKASVTAAADTDANIARNNLQVLAVGFGPVAPAMLVEVRKYVDEMQAPLAKAGLVQQGQLLTAEAGELPRLQAQIKEGLKHVRVSEIERKASQDVAYTARILDVTFRELNLVAVSPVAMFDVARIGPRTVSGYGGLRYGLGGGLRLSIVSVDFTAGYSWNPNRRDGEGRGAFVFSLDISDLFR